MNRIFSLVLLISAVGLLSGAAVAGTIPAGWACTGNCGTLGADGVVTLGPSGNPYEYISTYGGPTGVGQYPGIGGTNGSLLTTATFSALANDPLKFYFNFVTSDGAGYADYAWVALVDAGTSSSLLLFTARTTPGGNTVPGFGLPPVAPGVTLIPATVTITAGGPVWSPLGSYSGTCYNAGCGYTGWVESTYTIGSSGNYYLQFGVSNWLDQIYDTGLSIDNVTVHGVPIPGETPEPGTLIMFGSGILGLAGMLRRKLMR